VEFKAEVERESLAGFVPIICDSPPGKQAYVRASIMRHGGLEACPEGILSFAGFQSPFVVAGEDARRANNGKSRWLPMTLW
jgi:hypothetical protein